MGRKAFVSSDMAHDEDLYDVSQESPNATLLWPWIVTYFDDWGRGLRSPKRIKSQLFPNINTVTVEIIEEALELFIKYGLVEAYSDADHEYIAIPTAKWFRWQTHIRREKREKDNSKYPPCPSDCAQVREVDNEVREVARTSSAECKKTQKNDICSADPDLSTLPPYHPTPTKDLSGGGEGVPDETVRIQKHYEKTFGRFPNDVQLDKLSHFTQLGMELELVFAALDISRLKGKDISYAIGILERQHDRGIRTVLQSEMDESKRQIAVGGDSGAKHRNNPREVSKTSRTDGRKFGLIKE